MLSLDQKHLGEARAWLARAKGNLVRATQPKPTGAFWEDFCFDAQQAAEKALKALLIAHGVRFPYVHDLARLFGSISQSGIPLPPFHREADKLSQYAAESRYPVLADPVNEDEFQEAVRLASAVVAWVSDFIERTPGEGANAVGTGTPERNVGG